MTKQTTIVASGSLTLKAPRKTASENVVCLCRLLNILANFIKPIFAYKQTVWTQIRLLKPQADNKADELVVTGALRVKG